MFITCRKAVRLTSDNNTVWEMRPGYIGEIPEWVARHWYFEKLCADGTVTAIVSKSDKAFDDAELKAAALKAEAEKAAELKRLADEKAAKEAEARAKEKAVEEAKAAAKAEAEKEAKENGLDAAATKKLVAEKQAAAIEALGKE